MLLTVSLGKKTGLHLLLNSVKVAVGKTQKGVGTVSGGKRGVEARATVSGGGTASVTEDLKVTYACHPCASRHGVRTSLPSLPRTVPSSAAASVSFLGAA